MLFRSVGPGGDGSVQIGDSAVDAACLLRRPGRATLDRHHPLQRGPRPSRVPLKATIFVTVLGICLGICLRANTGTSGADDRSNHQNLGAGSRASVTLTAYRADRGRIFSHEHLRRVLAGSSVAMKI